MRIDPRRVRLLANTTKSFQQSWRWVCIGWLAAESQTVLTATAVARVVVGVHQSQHRSPLPRLATITAAAPAQQPGSVVPRVRRVGHHHIVLRRPAVLDRRVEVLVAVVDRLEAQPLQVMHHLRCAARGVMSDRRPSSQHQLWHFDGISRDRATTILVTDSKRVFARPI